MSDNKVFSENRIFVYNKTQKILFGISLITILLAIGAFALLYVLVFKNYDLPWVDTINAVASSISQEVMKSTPLGIFYVAVIGGLFFVYMPLEVMLTRFFTVSNSFFVVLGVYMFGVLISYSINYFIGFRLSRLSKKIISPRKFYSLKSKINKYGAVAIYVFNVFPLPSQPLATILGVFRYNRVRFYFFFLLGQLTKVVVVWLGVSYFS